MEKPSNSLLRALELIGKLFVCCFFVFFRYLPPECFLEKRDSGIRISNKVDVWSAGVIFFELLFARKPFGQGLSQEALLRSGAMLSGLQVEFPANSARVSKEAKEYIRQLLTVDRRLRPDVFDASNDPYIRKAI